MNKLSEDEAEIKIQDFISYVRFNEQPKYTEKDWLLAIETILNLYQQEKENNKELLKDREKSTEEYIHNNPWLYKQLSESYILKLDVDKNYISKDKIRAKIKELEEKSDYWNCDEIEVLKELLEEK